METQNTYEKVRQWAHARNLINGSTPKDQTLKLMSEYGEIWGAESHSEAKDAFGDCTVVLTILAAMYGADLEMLTQFRNPDHSAAEIGLLADMVLKGQVDSAKQQLAMVHAAIFDHCENGEGYSLMECFEMSYLEIKDRTGIMYNGAFIKSTDPAYAGAVAAVEAVRSAA